VERLGASGLDNRSLRADKNEVQENRDRPRPGGSKENQVNEVVVINLRRRYSYSSRGSALWRQRERAGHLLIYRRMKSTVK